MAGLQTEFDFRLPKGFVDADGTLHRRGTMRLATARDEIEPLRDSRVADAEDPFLTLLVLARVITALGTVSKVTVSDIESLFAADLAFLQDFYGVINFGTEAELQALLASVPEPAPPNRPAEVRDTPEATASDAPVGTDPQRPRRGTVEEVPSAQTQ